MRPWPGSTRSSPAEPPEGSAVPDLASLRADAVVVGSGAGGAPVAALLAEAGLEVLLLEAGPHIRAGDFSDDESQTVARLGTMVSTRDGAMNFYAGSCVGGSTVVNDALCWRTPPEILASWRRDYGLRRASPPGSIAPGATSAPSRRIART